MVRVKWIGVGVSSGGGLTISSNFRFNSHLSRWSSAYFNVPK